ncbi:MAG: hypothetical protein M3R54_00745 [Chloroflexota bacterium]|nr:hypothetical protein [Chloroflexota bacterium]
MSASAEGLLVLQEFRLDSIESTATVARIVEQASPAVPLLTSIEDPRDVATIRRIDADLPEALEERIALAPFVSAWKPARRYDVRVLEHAFAPPDYYRMAVTESGINDRDGADTTTRSSETGTGKGDPIGLLWIADPVGTHAGLLVVIGRYGRGPYAVGAELSDWPLALSHDLGVRIYEGSATTMNAHGSLIEAGARAN